MTGGDLVSTGTAIVAGTVAAGSLAAAGVGLAAGAAGAAGGGAAAGGVCRFSRWIIQRGEWRFFRAIWGRRIGAASISAFPIRGARTAVQAAQRPAVETGAAILCQFGER